MWGESLRLFSPQEPPRRAYFPRRFFEKSRFVLGSQGGIIMIRAGAWARGKSAPALFLLTGLILVGTKFTDVKDSFKARGEGAGWAPRALKRSK